MRSIRSIMKGKNEHMNLYLAEQMKKYALLQPQDLVKMAYQTVFGPEHMLQNPARALEMLRMEMKSIGQEEVDPGLLEPISDRLCRVHLMAWKKLGRTAEELHSLFLQTARCCHGSEADFFALIGEYKQTLLQLSPDAAADFDQFLTGYLAGGVRPVHHSEIFQMTYDPHYRLILRSLVE